MVRIPGFKATEANDKESSAPNQSDPDVMGAVGTEPAREADQTRSATGKKTTEDTSKKGIPAMFKKVTRFFPTIKIKWKVMIAGLVPLPFFSIARSSRSR